MITKKENCLDTLEALSRPGGESTLLHNDTLDPLRPFISIEITKGFAYDHIGTIEAQIHGLYLDSAEAVLQANCLQYGCLQDTGIWTTALITPISRLYEGVTQYWVRGDLDRGGSVYVVDIGYIYKLTGQPIIKEANVSIYAGGVLSSIESLPKAIKFLRLKRVSSSTSTDILHVFGEYPIPDPLIRPHYKALLKYNALDQKCDLEEISISILSLLMTSYFRKEDNQYLYRTATYVDPTITKIIEDNLSRLSRLVDLDRSSLRFGSIPRYVATYSEPIDIYGPSADEKYLNRTLKCFNDDCFALDCFEVRDNDLLVSREVDTRAMAWFLLALCTYEIVHPKEGKYLGLINIVTQYIGNQLEPRSSLPSDGWTHADLYSDSTLIDKHSTSTAVACTIALLKAYEITENVTHLDQAADIYLSITKSLRRYSDNLLVDHLESVEPSLEANIYGLILGSEFNRGDIVQSIITFLYSKTRNNYGSKEPLPIVDSFNTIIRDNSLQGIVAQSSLLLFRTNPQLLGFFYTFNLETLNLQETLKYNTILFNILAIDSDRGYDVSFSNILSTQQLTFTQLQLRDRTLSTSIFASNCLLDRNFFDEPLYKLNNKEELSTLIFNRSYLHNRLVKMWPLNFTWVSEQALSIRGNLGKLLFSLSRALAPLSAIRSSLDKNLYIKSATDTDLDRWGLDLLTNRLPRETDDIYRSRLALKASKPNNTKEAITQSLKQIEVDIEVSEVWKRILTLHDYEDYPGNSIPGTALLAGTNFATPNVIHIQTNQPFNKEALDELSNSKAAGIKAYVRESLEFPIQGLSTTKTAFIITEILRPTSPPIPEDTCPSLSNELGFNFITETGASICLEDTTIPIIPTPHTCTPLSKETGFNFLTESGDVICLEDVLLPVDDTCPSLTSELGFNFLTETGQFICQEDAAVILPACPSLLLEDGSVLLKEGTGRFCIEDESSGYE